MDTCKPKLLLISIFVKVCAQLGLLFWFLLTRIPPFQKKHIDLKLGGWLKLTVRDFNRWKNGWLEVGR